MNYKQLFLFSGREEPDNLTKEPGKSMGTAGVIRTFLLIDVIAIALLAIVYLRQRRMSWAAFFAWGMLALFVPVLGPFLVISKRPGEWDLTFSFSGEIRRLGSLIQRLLPDPIRLEKSGSSVRARLRRPHKRR